MGEQQSGTVGIPGFRFLDLSFLNLGEAILSSTCEDLEEIARIKGNELLKMMSGDCVTYLEKNWR